MLSAASGFFLALPVSPVLRARMEPSPERLQKESGFVKSREDSEAKDQDEEHRKGCVTLDRSIEVLLARGG